MIQRRQSFRLRIPWPFAPAGRPRTEPLRPKDRSKSPAHSDTHVPIHRPPSPPKPPVITPVEIPPIPIKTKEAPSAEPQIQSPSHPTQPVTSVIIESPVPSQSTTSTPYHSPLSKTPTPFHSPQLSQSKTSTPFHSPLPSFQPSSRASSPSPVSIVSSAPKTPPTSPSHLASDGIIEVAKHATEESTWPASSVFEQEKEKKAVSEPMPQDESKVSSPLKAITKSPETSFHSERASVQPQGSEQQPSSTPSTRVSKIEPASDQPLPSPPLTAEHTGEALKRNAEESTLHASPTSQEEKEKMAVSESVPQEAEPKLKSPLKTIPKSPETSFQHQRISEQQACSMPSSPVSKTEPASDKPPPSSPLASEHTDKVLKPSVEESPLPPSPAPEKEREKMSVMVSKLVPQEAESKIKSPLKTIPKSPETSFQHEKMSTQPQDFEQKVCSVPPFMDSKTEPASDQPPHPSSPLASERVSEVLQPKAEERTLPASSPSQEEKEKMALAVSEPLPQEAEPKMKSPLKTILKSPEASSKHKNIQPTPSIGYVERSTTPETKKLDLDGAAGSSKAPLETQSKLLESEGKEKEVHEPVIARKARCIATGQPSRHTIASASGTKSKDPFTRAFRADRKRNGARETVERKMVFSTSKPSEKDINFMSSISPEKAPLHKGIKDDVSKFVHKLATVDQTQVVDDNQFSAITLAGDNRGVTMEVGSGPAKKEGLMHIHRAYESDPEESTEVIIHVEETTEKDSYSLTKHDGVGKAYVNSNIQSINNSLMVHGSITERDPSVQVALPQKPAEPIRQEDQRDLETHKV